MKDRGWRMFCFCFFNVKMNREKNTRGVEEWKHEEEMRWEEVFRWSILRSGPFFNLLFIPVALHSGTQHAALVNSPSVLHVRARRREKTGMRALCLRCLLIFCFPKYRPIHLRCHTPRDTQLKAAYADTHTHFVDGSVENWRSEKERKL